MNCAVAFKNWAVAIEAYTIDNDTDILKENDHVEDVNI